MRLDAMGEDFILLSVSETNLKNLQEHGKLVLYGGSPYFPEIEIELILESDDRHLGSRLDQMDEIDGG